MAAKSPFLRWLGIAALVVALGAARARGVVDVRQGEREDGRFGAAGSSSFARYYTDFRLRDGTMPVPALLNIRMSHLLNQVNQSSGNASWAGADASVVARLNTCLAGISRWGSADLFDSL